ncbi:MAG TPA: acetyl-CoA carboxylase carboxyltransferase subunit beta [Rhodospirillaceae bacterium]|jgi:acetyl-CoA carboxylase carboxyl transferase subunit beta|nr:acetyl-CoA carboxylase, carboxyltransferase subunit beta [Rhodospirillales bacterium]HIJ42450.1 acetyl-CoA carboxylase carboxyltransferase subunit beta [Rhodospirillaceae bacterium]MDP7216188.1 acetyl-CoA carboxylase, carboxyltransferase subunit beta [Rhodospirillales bacterium]HIJ45799.1 acetyl-CoA carboxylase carboxyltransferase subunit beta [Rhodospirillaceae bacterium]HIJ91984.1 acetyl-CoA carboxylase carboxyltransferase subunit beta [Rhodospirillaceae bacterium]
MNWLKNLVRPKLRELVGRQKGTAGNLWRDCPECEGMIFHSDLEKDHWVCRFCGHHMRLEAGKRLVMLFDEDAYQTVELDAVPTDPLKFRDRRKYTERMKEAQNRTGETDALIVAHGKMGGFNVVIAALDFSFMGGSMGVAVGQGLLTAARLAVVQDASLIVVPSSGGARMQEGILSLMQMARTTIAVEEVREAGLPYIVVLADPTTGGVTASFAMLGDIAIAEPGAIIGFAGARVIEQTIREKLPEGFQRAEYLLDHGMIDMVVHRHELRDTLIRVIGLLRNTVPAADVASIPAAAETPAANPAPSEDHPAEDRPTE